MENIKTHDEFETLIKSKTSGINNLNLEIYDVCVTFGFQLQWVYSILRKNIHTDTVSSINFNNCSFKKIDCSNLTEFNNIEISIVGGTIDEFSAINSIFTGKFYINKQYGENKGEIQIDRLIISDCIFKENFKLHNAKVNVFSVENTDFEKHADFFKSSFQKGVLPEDKDEKICENDIGFKTTNFRGLALFGNTEFKRKLVFKYVTFESYSHFRQSKLVKGLDLDYSNIQNEMNFFNVQQLDTIDAKKNTSQETYRIIKYNFEKIGNKIEANKYLALELEQKKITLEREKNRKWLDYLVFKTHWASSEFGTNWLKPLIYIFLTSLATIGFIHFTLLMEVILRPSIFKFEYISKVIDELFQYMYILNKSDKLVSESPVLLFNKVLLGYLYYQFLVSIRKSTK